MKIKIENLKNDENRGSATAKVAVRLKRPCLQKRVLNQIQKQCGQDGQNFLFYRTRIRMKKAGNKAAKCRVCALQLAEELGCQESVAGEGRVVSADNLLCCRHHSPETRNNERGNIERPHSTSPKEMTEGIDTQRNRNRWTCREIEPCRERCRTIERGTEMSEYGRGREAAACSESYRKI